jgi:hypothetical protein
LLVERLAIHPVPADLVEELERLCRAARDVTRLPDARRVLENAILSLATELWAFSAEP